MVREGYFGCEEFLHRLPRLLDGEHDPADDWRLHDHLAWCEGCLRKYRFERQLIDAVRSRLAQIEVPPRLRERVASMLMLEPPAEPSAGGVL